MKPTLITGGAGFIGTNLAHHLLSDRHPVVVLDNLARPGVEENLRWLRDTHGDLLRVEVADVRDAAAVRRAVAEAGQVFHFAAQVAVTTSLDDPLDDFEVNARGTLNLLEAIREHPLPPPMVFTSTNKVYGALEDIALQRRNRRYEPVDQAIAARGVSESRPLDFHSPYGCSKGSADQYVLDYARSYGLPTIVFRMSCIYGPHQHGTEDQGWVAHFLIRAIEGRPITIYGDGRQVRDVLFVEDLVDALLLAQQHMPTDSGQAFNIGGGPANAVSLLELLDMIAELTDRPPAVRLDAWRPGDQRWYVSDTGKFARATGWRPSIPVREGLARLAAWLHDSGLARTPAANAAGGRG
jgi:CDP-paratose 2-epimerase